MRGKEERIRVLMAKPGSDGHWRGVIVVSMALMNAGMEVIYVGNQTPQEIVETAIQEDVDVIGLSILHANYRKLISEVTSIIRKKGLTDVLLLAGGVIPQEDIPKLKNQGIHEIFPPGSTTDSIVNFIRDNLSRTKRAPI